MATSHQERLGEIERRIAAVEEPHGLMRFIEENADLATAPGEIGVRYVAARGVVLNRTGLPGSARLELQKARDKAETEGVAALMSGISREIARVHVWRGETTSAALELLRSLVEADATGDRADVAASIAEYGRLNLETGRYEAALRVFDRLLDPARSLTPHLSHRETSRVPLNANAWRRPVNLECSKRTHMLGTAGVPLRSCRDEVRSLKFRLPTYPEGITRYRLLGLSSSMLLPPKPLCSKRRLVAIYAAGSCS